MTKKSAWNKAGKRQNKNGEVEKMARKDDILSIYTKEVEGIKEAAAEIASLEFVRDLMTAVPTSANVKYYAQIVADKSVMRKMIKLNEEVENMCYAGKEPLESIMEQTEKSMFQLLQRRTTGEYVPIKQVVLNALDKIEKASKSKGTVTGIPTGNF